MLVIKKDNKYLSRADFNGDLKLISNPNFAYVYDTQEEAKEVIETLDNKEEYQIVTL